MQPFRVDQETNGERGVDVVDGDARCENVGFADTEARDRWSDIVTKLLPLIENQQVDAAPM
jgi:hypothetical protein